VSYQQKDGTGALFVNDRKETSQHPDRTGTITIGGQDYWLSGWLKSTKDGKKYLSLSARPKVQKNAPAPEAAAGGGEEDPSDDLPF
jgi:hypothetical protein